MAGATEEQAASRVVWLCQWELPRELEARQKAYSTRVTAGLSKELELLGVMHGRMLQTHTNLRALKAEMGRLKVTAELQQSEREEWGKLSRDEIRAREEALQGAKGNVQKLSTQMQTPPGGARICVDVASLKPIPLYSYIAGVDLIICTPN